MRLEFALFFRTVGNILSQEDLGLFIQATPALLSLPLLSGFLFLIHQFLVIALGTLSRPRALPVAANDVATLQPAATCNIAPKIIALVPSSTYPS